MKCGHCGWSDPAVTVDHVWACSQGGTLRNPDVLSNEDLSGSISDLKARGTFDVSGPALQQAPRTPAMKAALTPSFDRVTLAKTPEAGVFVSGLNYYKVVQSPSTGNWYAKRFDDKTGAWEYAGKAPLHILTAANKITAEQAAAFGAVYGSCVNCGKTLTDERSIAVGYGSTCAANNGWPWGGELARETTAQAEELDL